MRRFRALDEPQKMAEMERQRIKDGDTYVQVHSLMPDAGR